MGLGRSEKKIKVFFPFGVWSIYVTFLKHLRVGLVGVLKGAWGVQRQLCFHFRVVFGLHGMT